VSRQQLPEIKDWLYEVKFDGYRCLADQDSTGVKLWSRRANRFTDQFPTIRKACEHLPPDILLMLRLQTSIEFDFVKATHRLPLQCDDA
jgi:ATP-dependent DNA ligase